jgi:hypothetical protein
LPHISRDTALKTDKDTSWMGDVYKLVFFVETFFQQFSYATILNNHGQLVLWRQRRARVVPRANDVFSRLQFFHCATARPVFRMMPFEQILALVKAARADGDPTQDTVLTELP